MVTSIWLLSGHPTRQARIFTTQLVGTPQCSSSLALEESGKLCELRASPSYMALWCPHINKSHPTWGPYEGL